MGSLKSVWRKGTEDMTIPKLGGGLLGGWAATAIPNMVGGGNGYKGVAVAGVAAVVGTVVVGRFMGKPVAIGYGIVAGTIVINRIIKAVTGMGVPYISGPLNQVLGRLGLGNVGGEYVGATEEEIFGADSYAALEPTYMGHGSYF